MRKFKLIKNNKGVSLIILVISIIVLIILAGVSIGIALGDNGVLNKGTNASTQAYLNRIAEDLKMAYRDLYEENNEDVVTSDIALKLIEKYRI